MHEARKAIREALAFAHKHLYTTNGQAWRQIIASLAFEIKADLSLIQYLDEQDQARFQQITQAFMNGALQVGDVIDLYLEFFPRLKEWKDFDGLLGGDDEEGYPHTLSEERKEPRMLTREDTAARLSVC